MLERCLDDQGQKFSADIKLLQEVRPRVDALLGKIDEIDDCQQAVIGCNIDELANDIDELSDLAAAKHAVLEDSIGALVASCIVV